MPGPPGPGGSRTQRQSHVESVTSPVMFVAIDFPFIASPLIKDVGCLLLYVGFSFHSEQDVCEAPVGIWLFR